MFIHRAIRGLTGVPVVKRVSSSLVKDKNTLKLHNYLVTMNIPKGLAKLQCSVL